MITIGHNQVQEKHVADTNSTRREDAHEAKKVYVGNKLAHVHVNDNTEFALRKTLNGYIHEDNDLYAEISKIKGNTKVWNQLVTLQYSGTSYGVTFGGNFINGMSLNGTVSATPTYSQLQISERLKFTLNHKYLVYFTGNGEFKIGISGFSSRNSSFIHTMPQVWEGYIFISVIQGDELAISNLHVNIIDLTLIYGAGNEPTTVAEFEADFQQWFGRPIGAEPYDAGSLIPFQATGIKSTWTKDGVQKEFTLPIPVTTLTGKQSGSTTSELIFPDGMKLAGSVKDEVYVEDGKTYAVKRVGSVDLGTLDYYLIRYGFISSIPLDTPTPTSGDINSNIVCSKYRVAGSADWYNKIDKTIAITGAGYGSFSCVGVQDTSYTDATTFKAAMSGVMLYYELATPIVYKVDKYTLPLYYVANGTGTEEIQSTATSAPADMDIEYRLRQRVRLVDMGTPGVLWADSDIDITKPDGFCDSPFTYEKSFFSWGNVVGHNPISNTAFDYDWGAVNQAEPWYEGQVYGSTPGSTLTGNIPADAQYDAVKAVLGGNWRMPSNAEYGALFRICKFLEADGSDMDTSKTDKRVDISDGNGGTVKGIYIESTVTGNRLFFSGSGYGNGRSWYDRGSSGYYWYSTWNSARNARSLGFGSGGVSQASRSSRYFGFALRPVYPISQ